MLRSCLTLAVLAASAAGASAQPVPPGGGAGRPLGGSYLGLLGGYSNPGFNYLGIVRPQQQLNQQFGQIQQQQQQLNTGLQQGLYGNNGLALGADPFLPFTGNVARFNSLGSYYSRNPINGAGGVYRGGFGAGGGSSFGSGFGGAGAAGSRAGGAGAARSGGTGARR